MILILIIAILWFIAWKTEDGFGDFKDIVNMFSTFFAMLGTVAILIGVFIAAPITDVTYMSDYHYAQSHSKYMPSVNKKLYQCKELKKNPVIGIFAPHKFTKQEYLHKND